MAHCCDHFFQCATLYANDAFYSAREQFLTAKYSGNARRNRFFCFRRKGLPRHRQTEAERFHPALCGHSQAQVSNAAYGLRRMRQHRLKRLYDFGEIGGIKELSGNKEKKERPTLFYFFGEPRRISGSRFQHPSIQRPIGLPVLRPSEDRKTRSILRNGESCTFEPLQQLRNLRSPVNLSCGDAPARARKLLPLQRLR